MIYRFIAFALLFGYAAFADDKEISLFSGSGKPTAYIATDEENTIFSWDGKPLAYLIPDSTEGEFHVYGFNGKHLGWFADGVARDHKGYAVCAVQGRVSSPEFEPYKSYKQYKPYRDYQQYAPSRPAFLYGFGPTPCISFLSQRASISALTDHPTEPVATSAAAARNPPKKRTKLGILGAVIGGATGPH